MVGMVEPVLQQHDRRPPRAAFRAIAELGQRAVEAVEARALERGWRDDDRHAPVAGFQRDTIAARAVVPVDRAGQVIKAECAGQQLAHERRGLCRGRFVDLLVIAPDPLTDAEIA
ncbi:MAG: hypothetical protein ACT6Q5_10305 [Sphingopyxis solisilvae]|uniref:hypothetical protein n=1 Tax=Sphingopyxis solisilvae TaxID=1886788 RepID=UPI004035E232